MFPSRKPFVPLLRHLPLLSSPQVDGVQQLTSMGFSKEQALETLALYDGDIQGAALALVEARDQQAMQQLMEGPGKQPAKPWNVEAVSTYAKLLGDKRTSDVTFIVGKEKAEVPAHKAILANCSRAFENMFFSEAKLMEATSSPVLEDVEPGYFKLLLEFCYTCKVDVLNFKTALNLYQLADRYIMAEFSQYLEEYLMRSIDKNNALTMYEVTKDPIFEKLHKDAAKRICDYASEILRTEGVLNNIPKESVVEILKLPLVASEFLILQRVSEFVAANPESENPVLSLIDIKRIGAEGIKFAMEHKLFPEKVLLAAMLGDGRVQTACKAMNRALPALKK